MLEFDVVFLLFLVLGMFQMAGFVVTLMKALVREISNNSGSLKRMKMAVSAAQGLIRARMPNATLKLKEFETLYALNPERFIPVYISSIDWNNFVFSYGFHRTEKKGVKAQAIGYYVCTDRSITSIRLPQKAMAELFGVQTPAISKHLKNIFEEGELNEKVVVSKMETTTAHGAIAGKTQRNDTNFYNLDAIISVGYRVNSKQATAFRRWATETLKEYIIKGFVDLR